MSLTLIAAQSLDGYITFHDTPGSGFASEADRAHFSAALRQFDSCVMGAATYRTAREAIRRWVMPDRLRMIVTRSPASFEDDAVSGTLEFSDSAPATLLTALRKRGYRQTALLGGAQIHSLFLEAGLVDALWLTIEPRLFGGGTPLLAQALDVRLELLSVEHLALGVLLVKYKPSPRP